jgi:hypothetical protein
MEGITMEVEVEEVSMAGELIVDQAVGEKIWKLDVVEVRLCMP